MISTNLIVFKVVIALALITFMIEAILISFVFGGGSYFWYTGCPSGKPDVASASSKKDDEDSGFADDQYETDDEPGWTG